MRQLNTILTAATLLFISTATSAQAQTETQTEYQTPKQAQAQNQPKTVAVDRFQKVIISPYIQATFVEGTTESVTVNNCIVDADKLHIEVNGNILRIYLEGAKEIPKNEQNENDHGNHHLYPNHAVVVTVSYKKLESLSVRGEETTLCQSPLSAKTFSLRIYGDSRVVFTEAHFAKMYTTMYGDGSLDIRSGDINRQHYTSFGDGKVYATAIGGRSAKLTSFGESEFRMNVTDRIKITSFGEAKLCYLGNPDIVKGLHFGGVTVSRLEPAGSAQH
jgi:hypothetical protein